MPPAPVAPAFSIASGTGTRRMSAQEQPPVFSPAPRTLPRRHRSLSPAPSRSPIPRSGAFRQFSRLARSLACSIDRRGHRPDGATRDTGV